MKEIILFFLMLFALLVGSDQEAILPESIQGEPVLGNPTQGVVQPRVLDSPLPTPQPTRPEPTVYPTRIPASPTPPFSAAIAGTPQPVPGEVPQPIVPYPGLTEVVIVTQEANPTIEGK